MTTPNPDAAAPEGTGSEGSAPETPASEERTFTQADVDRIVQERLARAKATPPPDYEELKAKAARLDELEAAQMSELERERQAREAAEQAAAAAVARANELLTRAAVMAEATRQNAADAETVIALIPEGSVTVGDDGQVTGAAEAVKELLKAKPFLVASGQQTVGSGDGGPQGQPAPAQLSRADLARMSPEEIVQARKDGRLKDLMGG